MSETIEERDIIHRLRSAEKRCADRYGGGQAWADYGDAADEIEWLRAKIVILENDIGWWRDGFQKVAPPLPPGK